MSGWGLFVAALAVVIYFLLPQEFEVALWKSAVVASAAFAGYWFDRTLFPYARPHTLLSDENDSMWSKSDPTGHVFVGSMIRRAIIVVGSMVAVAVAL
jgi:hypothetical protein